MHINLCDRNIYIIIHNLIYIIFFHSPDVYGHSDCAWGTIWDAVPGQLCARQAPNPLYDLSSPSQYIYRCFMLCPGVKTLWNSSEKEFNS